MKDAWGDAAKPSASEEQLEAFMHTHEEVLSGALAIMREKVKEQCFVSQQFDDFDSQLACICCDSVLCAAICLESMGVCDRVLCIKLLPVLSPRELDAGMDVRV